MENQFKPGQKVIIDGFEATIVAHYFEGMWEVRMPGGVTVVAHNYIKAA